MGINLEYVRFKIITRVFYITRCISTNRCFCYAVFYRFPLIAIPLFLCDRISKKIILNQTLTQIGADYVSAYVCRRTGSPGVLYFYDFHVNSISVSMGQNFTQSSYLVRTWQKIVLIKFGCISFQLVALLFVFYYFRVSLYLNNQGIRFKVFILNYKVSVLPFFILQNLKVMGR